MPRLPRQLGPTSSIADELISAPMAHVEETDYTPDERELPRTPPPAIPRTRTPPPAIPRTSRKFTIAPIAGNPKTGSYKNYATMVAGPSWKWSDAKENGSRVGDYFAFFFTEHKLRPIEEQVVVIHKITEIRKQILVLNARGVLYGCGPGDWEVPILDDRMTLILSEPLKQYTLEEWKSCGGGMKKNGTYRTDKGQNIFN